MAIVGQWHEKAAAAYVEQRRDGGHASHVGAVGKKYRPKGPAIFHVTKVETQTPPAVTFVR